MTLAKLFRYGLVQRPRASGKVLLGQAEIVLRPTRDPAMLLAAVRATEDHLASHAVGDVRSMLCIGQKSAEDIAPRNSARRTAGQVCDRHAAGRDGPLVFSGRYWHGAT